MDIFTILIIFAFLVLLALIALFKLYFGTFSVEAVFKKFELQRKLEKKYSQLFSQREALLYHISWAKV